MIERMAGARLPFLEPAQDTSRKQPLLLLVILLLLIAAPKQLVITGSESESWSIVCETRG